jgi:hypothetical protein
MQNCIYIYMEVLEIVPMEVMFWLHPVYIYLFKLYMYIREDSSYARPSYTSAVGRPKKNKKFVCMLRNPRCRRDFRPFLTDRRVKTVW